MGIGKRFMPTMDEGAVPVQTEKLPSINLEHIGADRARSGNDGGVPETATRSRASVRTSSDSIRWD